MSWDARRPQKNFRYLEHPRPPQETDYDASIRHLLAPGRAQHVSLFNDLQSMLRHELRMLAIRSAKATLHVALQRPCPAEFLAEIQELGYTWHFVSADPEEFLATDFSRTDILLWSHPNRADGFYYPQELYEHLFAHLISFANLQILVDESLGLFAFNNEAPGSLREIFRSGRHSTRLDLCGSLFPTYSPHGPDLAWHERGAPLTASSVPAPVDPDILLQAFPALLAFQNRQGRGVAEFQRRMLVARYGLRDFADGLKEVRQAGLLLIPHWPESGFYMLLDLAPFLRQHRMSLAEALTWLHQEHGIQLNSGVAFGQATMAQLCFAANPDFLRDIARALQKALLTGPLKAAIPLSS